MATETILHGSVRCALKCGYLTGRDIFLALVDLNTQDSGSSGVLASGNGESSDPGSSSSGSTDPRPPREESQSKAPRPHPVERYIAYREVFTARSISHYLNGKHFLTYVSDPGYGAIYILLGFDCDAPILDPAIENTETDSQTDQPQTDHNQTVFETLFPAMKRLHLDPRFRIKMKIITDVPGESMVDALSSPLIIRARSQNYLRRLNSTNYSDVAMYFASGDDLDNISSLEDGSNVPIFISRMKHLIKNAPNYWIHVAKPMYLTLFRSLYQDGKLIESKTTLPLEEIRALLPELFPASFNDLSPLVQKITLLPPLIQLYVLGYPLHLGHPGSNQDGLCHQAMKRLSEVGKVQYAESITESNSHEIIEVPNTFGDGVIQTRNREDVLDESVFAYNSFDRIVYYSGANRYYFVRTEFESLLKSKKNHWTQEPLPRIVIGLIRNRMKMADKFHLPPPGTVIELLTRIEEDRLYQSNFPAEPENNEMMNGLLQAFYAIMNNSS